MLSNGATWQVAMDFHSVLTDNDAVLRRLSQILCVWALVLCIGAQWTFLQSAAWIGMALRFARTETWSGALQKTFDGQHPCALCHVVAQGKQSERTQDKLKLGAKFDWDILAKQVPLYAPAPILITSAQHESASLRFEKPHAPPPRRA